MANSSPVYFAVCKQLLSLRICGGSCRTYFNKCLDLHLFCITVILAEKLIFQLEVDQAVLEVIQLPDVISAIK